MKSLRGYISLLTACKKAKEVGEVVATMCRNEEAIDADLIAKKDFIHLLLPFLTNVKTGKGVDNLRLYINNAWDARKRLSASQIDEIALKKYIILLEQVYYITLPSILYYLGK